MARMISTGARLCLVLVSFFAAMTTTGAAHAATVPNVNWSRVASYASAYSCNGRDCHNTAYPEYDSDCTNLLSQALYYGGMPMERHSWINYSAPEWYFDHSNNSRSKSWANVMYFMKYFGTEKRWATATQVPSMGAQYSPAWKGDVYIYDWGRGQEWSHLSMSTGWGSFASYTDPQSHRNYTSITGGKGDYMAQHTSNRDYAPWNYGYWTESNPSVRVKMRTAIMHWNR